MKYIYKKIVFSALITVIPVVLNAQTTANIPAKEITPNAKEKPLNRSGIRNEKETSKNVVVDSLITRNLGNDLLPVQVAHRKVEKKDLHGDVSVVNVPEMLERNYTINTLENMEALANGFHGNIWGMDSYLVLVDGVPRDVGSVMPTEIEQITFLKGVSAVALYGSRAAKGVVYITTKRGEAGDLQIKARVNSGIFVPKSYPKYLGSAEYMTLYNEARRNDGLSNLYSDDIIYNHAAGENPYRYPNVDYYSPEYLKKTYNRYDGTVEISGGNKVARYYTNIGYNTVGSLLNFGEAKNNNTSDRFNVRGNVDVDINEFIYAKVDAAAIYPGFNL